MNLRRLSLLSTCLSLFVALPGAISADAPNATRSSFPEAVLQTEYLDLAYVEGGHARQKLDLFLPDDTSKPRPLLVWIHGGAWEGGSKERCPAKAMVQRGYAVASINYRLSRHAVYPAQIQDCKAAIRWLRAHAEQYRIDTTRVGVWGASAGGHLVALLGTTGHLRDFDVGAHLDQPSRVQCVINWFGPTDFLNYGQPGSARLDKPSSAVTRLLGGTVAENLERARRTSPVYFVRQDAAPFLIMQGDRDLLVPLQQSELLHAALQKAGVESELKILKGAGHGGGSFHSPENLKRMAEFCDRHLLHRSIAAR